MRKILTLAQVEKKDANIFWQIKEIMMNVDMDSESEQIALALDRIAHLLK